MHIAFLLKKYPKSSETFIANQARALVKRGHEIDIYAQEQKSDQVLDTNPGVGEVTYFGGISASDKLESILRTQIPSLLRHPDLLRRVLEHGTGAVPQTNLWKRRSGPLLRRIHDYDVIHAHYGPVGNAFQFLSSKTEAPFVTSFYGYDASELLKKNPWRYERLFDSATVIGSLSSEMDGELVRHGCPSEKLARFPLPVDTEAFQFSPPSYGGQRSVQLLSVCRLVEKKGIEYVLPALESLSREFEITYRIAGDGPLRDDLEHQVSERGLEEEVRFLGWKSSNEVADLMEDSDVFVQTSVTASDGDKEGTPTVLLEAQARGLPVVSTYHAGIPEVVDDGHSGLLVPERDSDAIEEALQQLLADPTSWEEFGQNGRELVEARHSLEAVADVLKQLYAVEQKNT